MKAFLHELVPTFDGEQRLTIVTKEDCRKLFDDLHDKEVEVTIKLFHKKRSLNANSYMWVLLDKMAQVLHVNPSILQDDLTYCYTCGRTCEKLDRHEIFSGPYRSKSKAMGLWVMLCHESCHLNGVHAFPKQYEYLKKKSQRIAMERFGWDKEKFISEFGRSYL